MKIGNEIDKIKFLKTADGILNITYLKPKYKRLAENAEKYSLLGLVIEIMYIGRNGAPFDRLFCFYRF